MTRQRSHSGSVTSTLPSREGFRRCALTLVETIITMSLVSGLLVAAMQTVGMAAKLRQSEISDARGMALAGDLMSEIQRRWYSDPDEAPTFGPESSESAGRSAWDDVDDYKKFSESALQSKAGVALTDVKGYSWSASVAYADLSDPRKDSATDTGLLRVTVTVTGPTGRVYSLIALRSKFGGFDLVPTATTTYTTGVTIELKVASDDCVTTGGNPLSPVGP